MRRLADFTLFGAIFIAFCAVAFCWETNKLLHLPPSHWSLYLFVFGATLAQYNLHYYFKKQLPYFSERQQWSLSNRKSQLILLVIGAAMVLISLFWLSPRHFMILLVLALLASLYSFPLLPFGKKRLKEYGILKILLLSLEWTLVTVWFPASQEGVDMTSYGLVLMRRFLFMMVLCLLFDLRDKEIDAQQNIKTIAVRLGAIGSYKLADMLLITFVLLSVLQFLRTDHIGFFCAMLISALLTRWMITQTKKYKNDYIYLAGIDGMMLVQAILVEIGSQTDVYLNFK